MRLTTSVDFENDKLYRYGFNGGLIDAFIELLDSFRYGSTLVLKKRKASSELIIQNEIDNDLLIVEEDEDELLSTVLEADREKWKVTLESDDSHSNILITEVRVSVEMSKLILMIECDYKMRAKSKRVNKLNVIDEKSKETDDNIFSECVDKLRVYYLDQVAFLRRSLQDGVNVFISYDKEYRGFDEFIMEAMLAFFYVNIINLRQVVFVDSKDLYRIKHDNIIIDNPNKNPEVLRELDIKNKSQVVPARMMDSRGSLLGCYTYCSKSRAEELNKRYKKLDTAGGRYIFLCSDNIDTFSKKLWKNIPDESMIKKDIDFVTILGIDGIDMWGEDTKTKRIEKLKQIIFKLVFLHEVGHMCCNRLSYSDVIATKNPRKVLINHAS